MNAKIPLGQVSVASPCHVSWDAMAGDNHARFCGQCKQHVYNLSELTADAATALIEQHDGQMCVRFYKRADGTMMTQDCPSAWRAVKRRIAFVGAAAAVVVAAFSISSFTGGARGAGAGGAGVPHKEDGGIPFVNPIARLRDWLFPPPPAPPPPLPLMGLICPPKAPPVAPPPP